MKQLLFTIYDTEWNIITQFDTYKDLANYIGTSIKTTQCIFTPSKIGKKVMIKSTGQWCYIIRDYI